MTNFVYKAKKNNAETVTGKINAQSPEEAIDLIHQLGFLPITIEPVEAGQDDASSIKSTKVYSKDLLVFTRQLANLLKSGITLLKGLHILESQTPNRYLRVVIQQIGWDVKNGKSFSESLSKFPDLFNSLYITLIKAGEESGYLHATLVNIANYKQRQEEIKSKVRMAMAYPIFMSIVGFLSIYFMLVFVLPKMTGLFEHMGQSLPWPTLILLNVSKVINKYGWIVIIFLIGAGLLIYRWIKSANGKIAISQILVNFPFIGKLILKTELASFSRTLVLLNQGGVSLVKSLDIAIPILNNELIKEQLYQSRESLVAGGSLGESLKQSTQIPSMVGHLISVGEETGNLNDVLSELAQSYEHETNDQIKIMTSLLEPLMILIVGLVVGFIVFAMLLPIFEMDVMAK